MRTEVSIPANDIVTPVNINVAAVAPPLTSGVVVQFLYEGGEPATQSIVMVPELAKVLRDALTEALTLVNDLNARN